MTFDEYGDQAITTLVGNHATGDIDAALLSCVFGLVGESGEVAEKFKKIIRDKSGKLADKDKKEILKELGDVLWYINSVANALGSDITEVAEINLDKIMSRKQRGATSGSGDNR